MLLKLFRATTEQPPWQVPCRLLSKAILSGRSEAMAYSSDHCNTEQKKKSLSLMDLIVEHFNEMQREITLTEDDSFPCV